MLITTIGKTIARQNNYKLVEYSCGDHEESIYYIYNKEKEIVEMFYRNPRKGHREALREMHRFITELQSR